MVAVISCPTQSQFRQISCTDHQAVRLVGYIHQYLGSFTGLAVFISNIMYGNVVSDVFEMLKTSLFDTDFLYRYSQRIHEIESIVVGTVGRPETRHGDTLYLFAGKVQPVESPYCYQ